MNLLPGVGGASNRDGCLNPEQLGIKQREFLALLNPALPSLSRFCRAMCRRDSKDAGTKRGCDEERAKDLISETLLKAFEHFDRVREHQAFLSYLFTIAVRIHRHERSRRKRWEPFSRKRFEDFVDPHNAPDENADADMLYAALAKLPLQQSEAIVLSEISGLKLLEIATIQNVSLSAVKSRISRGKKKLAKLLGVPDEPEREELNVERTMEVPASNGTNRFGTSRFNGQFAFQAKEEL